jgi:prophage regulatory protein
MVSSGVLRVRPEDHSMTTLRRFLRIRTVEQITGLKKSAIYERIARGKFPKPVPLGDFPNSPVAWPENEIIDWQQTRINKRESVQAEAI